MMLQHSLFGTLLPLWFIVILQSHLASASTSLARRRRSVAMLSGYDLPYKRQVLGPWSPMLEKFPDEMYDFSEPNEYAPAAAPDLDDLMEYVQPAQTPEYNIQSLLGSPNGVRVYPNIPKGRQSFDYLKTRMPENVPMPETRGAQYGTVPYQPNRVEPTLKELEELFGSTNVPVKRLDHFPPRFATGINEDQTEGSHLESINDDVQQTGEGSHESSSTGHETKEDIVEKTLDKASKMNALLEAAQKLGKSNKTVPKSSGTNTGSTTDEGIKNQILQEDEGKSVLTEEQLDDLFSDADTDAATEKMTGVQETEQRIGDEAVPEGEVLPIVTENDADSSVETLIRRYIAETKSISKRGTRENGNFFDVQQLLQKIKVLKKKLANLQILQILEEKENNALANALKFGTLDQIDERSDYERTEYNSIEKATEIEELIQLLSSQTEESNDYKEAEGLLDDFLNLETDGVGELEHDAGVSDNVDMYGGEEEGPGNQGLEQIIAQLEENRWMDQPVQENAQPIEVEQDDEEDYPGSRLTEAAQLLSGDQAEPVDALYTPTGRYGNEEEIDYADNVAGIEKKATLDDTDKGLLLQQLLKGISSEDLNELVNRMNFQEEEDQKDDPLEDAMIEETCPAVEEMSADCQFADSFEIPIDEEARHLCVRHQMCYTCGNGIGFSENNCDEGFASTAMETCEGDDRCLRNALLFLRLMQRVHEFRPYSPGLCSAPCVEDFILGV